MLKKLFWISCCLALLSCEKYAKEEYPEEHYCEKFAGKYHMYDPLNNEYYDMIISCKVDKQSTNDTMLFFNFANRYDFIYNLAPMGVPYRFNFNNKIIYGQKDHVGNSTLLTVGPNSTSPPQNMLINDSLYIIFTINNTAYYTSDGVPYEYCNGCEHYGKKIH